MGPRAPPPRILLTPVPHYCFWSLRTRPYSSKWSNSGKHTTYADRAVFKRLSKSKTKAITGSIFMSHSSHQENWEFSAASLTVGKLWVSFLFRTVFLWRQKRNKPMQRKRCCDNFICSRSRILKLLVHTKELLRNYDLFSRFYDGSVKLKNIFYKRLLRQSTRNFNIPSPSPGHSNLWRLDGSNSRPLGPKYCSNALSYRRICLSNTPSKEQSSSAPVVFDNKPWVKTCQHMSCDHLHDDAVYKNITLILKL